MNSNTTPTQITDKNGKNTTVHKNLAKQVAVSRVDAFDAANSSSAGQFMQQVDDATVILSEKFGKSVAEHANNVSDISNLITEATKRFQSVKRAEFAVRAQALIPGFESVNYKVETDFANGGYYIDVDSYTANGFTVTGQDASDMELASLFKEYGYNFLGDTPSEGSDSFILAEEGEIYESGNEILAESYPDPIMDNEAVGVLITLAAAMKERANYKKMGDEMKEIDPSIEAVIFTTEPLEDNIGYSVSLESVSVHGDEIAMDIYDNAFDMESIFQSYIYDTLPASTRGGWTTHYFTD